MSDKWLTTSEIADKWGIYSSTVRWAIKNNRLQEGEYKKTGFGPHGGVWLIREDAVRRLWGKPKLSQADISEHLKQRR